MEVRTTRLEFISDFATMLTMMFMFGYYDQPLILAILFVVLGSCDLVWVINHIGNLRAIGKLAQRRRWLRDKMLAIGVYVLATVTVWVSISLRGRFANWVDELLSITSVSVLFAAYSIARRFLFGQVRKIRTLGCRPATVADIEDIVKIHNAHALATNRSLHLGFLLQETSSENMRAALADPSNRYFVAIDAGRNNMIIGYVATQKQLADEVFDHVIWRHDSLRQWFTIDRHIHISHVAVAPGQMGRGVGQYLYRHLYQVYPRRIISTFVARKPYPNQRSLAFHKSQGFQVWGIFRAESFAGLREYESILFAKDTYFDE